jgi:hypothetical protein
MCKVDYAMKTFIHAPSFNFKEVMRILDFTGVVEAEKWCWDEKYT